LARIDAFLKLARSRCSDIPGRRRPADAAHACDLMPISSELRQPELEGYLTEILTRNQGNTSQGNDLDFSYVSSEAGASA